MEQLILTLAMAVIDAIPTLVQAVSASNGMTEDEKRKQLMELNIRLTEANVRVQQVRFKEVPLVGTTAEK